MHAEVQALKEGFAELKLEIRGMVKAWEAAGSLLTVVKWVSVVGAAIATFFVALKTGLSKH